MSDIRVNINNFFSSIFHKSQKKYIAMFHTGRCGSTVLGRMLNDHYQVFWANEIFHEYMNSANPESGKVFAEKIINASRNAQNKRIYGFETKYLPQQHLSKKCINLELNEYVSHLRKLKFKKFIILHRENYLRRAVSAEVGRQTKRWHTNENIQNLKKITLKVDSYPTGGHYEPLLDLFVSIDKYYNTLNNLLIDDDTLSLTYENDILVNPEIAYAKVCKFLSITEESPEINLKRTNPFLLKDMIENFDEVKEYFADTKYSWMLDN